jgi:DNA invertase Pin-like site-specific DNA recombinase
LSKEDGDKIESDSIANQKELIRAFAEKQDDIAPAGCYEDDGYTGVNYDRPDFKRMVEDIKSGKINCVIVKDLSRLGRNYIETGKLLERFFPFMGVRFIAVNDAYDSLKHNAQTDNLIIPFKNLINDAYCADISKKVRSQFEVRRKNGDFIGSFAAYGFAKDPEQKGRIIIDEEAASVVRDIFRWKIEGMSQQGIADRLNNMGVPSPLEHKKASGSKFNTSFAVNARSKWSAVSVGRILKNDACNGVLTQGVSTTANYKVKRRIRKPESEWARIENAHEAIVDSDEFSLAARLLGRDTRVKPGGGSVYLFSGLLYCGDCGRALSRKPVKGSGYAYYVCSTYKNGNGCKSHSISEKVVYDAVYGALAHHIRRCVEIERLMAFIKDMPLHSAEADNLRRQIQAKREELDKISRRKVRLYEDFSDEIIAKDDYLRFKAAFESQYGAANDSLAVLESELSKTVSGARPQALWIQHFTKHHEMQSLTRPALVELVERIDVYEGKRLNVSVSYRDEFAAVMSRIRDMPGYGAERGVV